jgi:phosphoribosylformimino-5-aminoimidazole carboxamide ribotide isomerase
MQLIPVIDLARGRAVQARGGDRAGYRPVSSILIPGRDGDALALVQAYRELPGVRECYVADLDAIQGGGVQAVLLRGLTAAAAPATLMVDAGTRDAASAREVLTLGAGGVVIGLETLQRFDDLAAIVEAEGPERVIFSLDLRHGRPIGSGESLEPEALAARAVDAGVRSVLVLDLARVGTGAGLDLELLGRLRRRLPTLRLLTGGGVSGPDDVARLEAAGCDGVLVATALHTGRLGQSSASASRQVAD